MMTVCSKCIYDNTISNISFDKNGICNYCNQIEKLKAEYGTGEQKGENKFQEILKQIRIEGKNKKYDCIIGVSGGTDSSYLLYISKQWGLRPLAVHYDNTWNSSVSTENIRKVTSNLGVDLHTYVIDNKEADDIFRSFLLAGVPEFDASTDIGFVQVLRTAAAKYKVKYILEGHSFVSEGVSPMGKNYFDGKYIKSVHKKYGKSKLKTFPNLTFFQFMKWILFYRQKFIRPLWYINYSKPEARKILEEITGWQYYGGHHLENRATAFLHKVYNPTKFNIDNRNWSLAAEVRSGILDRNEALRTYNTPIEYDYELVEYVKKRLNLSDEGFTEIMNGPKRTFRDFKTYKRRFEKMRFLFKILASKNLVPMSFYLKYCFPLPE